MMVSVGKGVELSTDKTVGGTTDTTSLAEAAKLIGGVGEDVGEGLKVGVGSTFDV